MAASLLHALIRSCCKLKGADACGGERCELESAAAELQQTEAAMGAFMLRLAIGDAPCDGQTTNNNASLHNNRDQHWLSAGVCVQARQKSEWVMCLPEQILTNWILAGSHARAAHQKRNYLRRAARHERLIPPEMHPPICICSIWVHPLSSGCLARRAWLPSANLPSAKLANKFKFEFSAARHISSYYPDWLRAWNFSTHRFIRD